MTCTVEELELIRLIDGELTENRAQELRKHIAGCSACAPQLRTLEKLTGRLRLSGTNAAFVESGFLEALERRLPAVAIPAPPRRRRAPLVAVMASLAAAAAIALWVVPGRHVQREFAARGEQAPWHALVTLNLGAADGRQASAEVRARPLVPGLRLGPGDAIVVSARNGSQRSPAYLMVFAVDANRTVHWIQPVWSDPADNPRSVALTAGGPALTAGVVPERPAAGLLKVVSLLSRAPLDVRTVENLVHEDRPLTAKDDDRHLTSVELQMAGEAGH